MNVKDRILALAASRSALSYNDIAAACGVSRGSVAGHIYRDRHPEKTTRDRRQPASVRLSPQAGSGAR